VKVLVIGASGMIGSTMLRVLSERSDWDIFGTVRNGSVKQFFSAQIGERLRAGIDVVYQDSLVRILDQIKPDVVVNCAGLTKHKPEAEDPLVSIPINTMMPHRLAGLCKLIGARLIHISTDCVFSGEKGGYVETDFADARDVYGKSKALGEVHYPHAITLRTSTIGHELHSQYGLLEWFLGQHECKGYRRAIFSGLPTIEFSRVVRDIVIQNENLSGLYNVGASQIDKESLLRLIAKEYGKSVEIIPDDLVRIDRSLNVEKFANATGYRAPSWPELIAGMREDMS
jgi:dTDP-4-dehydrorhamnose reductase